MSSNSPNKEVVDGEVVSSRRARISWAWLFPILALGATGWLFLNNWLSQGPEVTIRFQEAPGIQPGKTDLIYRGVQAGKVMDAHLDRDLGAVVLRVRLKAFARELAREGTDFWIEQPIISLREISGIESIIQGNSIHARIGEGTKVQTEFVGLGAAPLVPLDAPSLVVKLRAAAVPFLGRSTPVFHRGVRVGWVRDKQLDESGDAVAEVVIEEKYTGVLHANSRFWVLPATSLSAGPGSVSLSIPGVEALLYGAVAFDHFGSPTGSVENGQEFALSPDEASARATGAQFQIVFDDAAGLRAGMTRICFRGKPVGVVDSIAVPPVGESVVVTARLEAPFASIATDGSTFTIVRPSITPEGITGLETVVTGAYIDFEPGPAGSVGTKFLGKSVRPLDWNLAEELPGAVRYRLVANSVPALQAGAPVFFRGLQAGHVVSKQPGDEEGAELWISIRKEFQKFVRSDSRFWHVPAASVQAGPGVLDFRFEGIASLWQGGIGFESFGNSTEPVASGEVFALHASRKLAAAVSPAVKISFLDGQGFLAGQTELRYLGLPAGVVEAVRTFPDRVEVTARFYEGFDFLRRDGSEFAVVRPQISIQSVSGLETLVSGVFIVCVPGKGEGYASEFQAIDTSMPELLDQTGFEILLLASSTAIDAGAPVLYNDTQVGEVVEKTLTQDGAQILLRAKIREEFRHLVRESSVFWDATAIDAKVGFFKVQINAPSVVAPAGRVEFFTPEMDSPGVGAGSRFSLLQQRPKSFRRR